MRSWTDREGPVHLSVLNYLRTVLHGAVVHHSPNAFGMAGADVARQIAKHKHMGMVPGFPDLLALTFHGPLFFEVKAEGGLSEAQKAFHADLRRMNYRVAVVRCVEDVRCALAEWGIPTRESHPTGELMP